MTGHGCHYPICVAARSACVSPPSWTATYCDTTWTNHIRVEFNRKNNEEEGELTTELTEPLPVVSAWYVNTHFTVCFTGWSC